MSGLNALFSQPTRKITKIPIAPEISGLYGHVPGSGLLNVTLPSSVELGFGSLTRDACLQVVIKSGYLRAFFRFSEDELISCLVFFFC